MKIRLIDRCLMLITRKTWTIPVIIKAPLDSSLGSHLETFVFARVKDATKYPSEKTKKNSGVLESGI